ncbi:helix-turn-helix domain-containing protein [Spirosoma radiotolerans]|uniref:AraC family transcriptional regulator n=1 Tax=Spirosoma radiotolerans TaxID=1379870 RepID=A0A0E3ZV78_9BACT|nr:AraC family transcriptional regulator [Spirosoma radiotolerans]AKD54883.1 AraC family transcriptional regulator [Spirosoma radiotolerans]
MKEPVPYAIRSITEYHQLLGLPKPKHPLFSVIDHQDVKQYSDERLRVKTYAFYTISMKKGYAGKMKYGQTYYDFDEGAMVFHGPRQVITSELTDDMALSGWSLLIHPDFIHPYPLFAKWKQTGFFAYTLSEALHPSDEEIQLLETILGTIRHEYRSGIDRFSQDILISQLEVLLNYCNRFYHRQFLTRKKVNHDLLSRLDALLDEYFTTDQASLRGVPTVQQLADHLTVSASYLSDMLRVLTGQSAQQHLTDHIIERGKELLATTSLSVGEIAFRLGYENPQGFHKLFKAKTQQTPLAFRASLN